jgi:TonB family protein
MKASSRLFLLVALFAIGTNTTAATNLQQQEQRPKVLHQVAPVYPDEAKRARVEGKVMLDVTIKANGEVSMVKVVNGHQLLQQAAVDAANQWRFSSPFNDPVTIQLMFDFSLKPERDAERKETSTAERPLTNTRKVEPVYPEEAKHQRIQGVVAVEITVNESGEVTDARAVSGNDALRQASVDAARQFRFSNTLNAPVSATLTFNFVLGDKK